MKRFLLIMITIAVISYLVLGIIALTNMLPDNPFENDRLLIVLGGFVVFGFAAKLYKRLLVDNDSKNKKI